VRLDYKVDMSSDRGKGKAPVPVTEDTDISAQDDAQSVLSRITASASGLTRSVFTSPNNNESAISALSSSGKGNSSTPLANGSSAWAESSKTSQQSHQQAGGSAGLKAGHSEEHVRQSEEEFSSFLDGIDSFSASGPSGTIGVDSYKDIGSTWGEAWARAQTIEAHEVTASTPRSGEVVEQEKKDGQEVLDLLSSPGWINHELEPPSGDEDTEGYDWGLSHDQISQIRAMTQHLKVPEAHSACGIENPLNLIPNLDAEGRVQWIEQWEGVLTRYADEVWGGLLPLIKEARKEIEEIQHDGTVSEKPTALRRLEAILSHLQQR
jgi:hypothetical protein